MALIALLFASSLFFFAPATVYFTNTLEFTPIFSDIFYYLLAASSIAFLAVLGIMVVVRKYAVHPRLVSVLFMVSALVWLQGNIMVWDYGQFDGGQIDWSRHLLKGILEVTVWGYLIAFSLSRPGPILRFARKGSLCFIAIQLASTMVLASKAPGSEFKRYVIDTGPKFEFSSKMNVIILTLDGFQSDIFEELINESERYKRMFEGFTFFRDTIGGFPTTYPSVTMILTGRYYDNSMPVQDYIKMAFLSSSSIPKALKDFGFEVDLFPDRDCEVYLGPEVLSNIRLKDRLLGKNMEEARYAISDIFNIVLFRYSPHFLKQYLYEKKGWNISRRPSPKELETSIKMHSVIDDMGFVRKMERTAVSTESKRIFKFYHLWGLHSPFILNEKLEVKDRPRNREGVKTHAKGVLELTGRFLEKLKRIGAYDNSLILIIGDHGTGKKSLTKEMLATEHRSRAFDKEIELQAIKGSAHPLVLIKMVGGGGGVTISDAPVQLSDIPATIASLVGLKDRFRGRSMFEVSVGDAIDRKYFFYTWDHSYYDNDYLPPMREYSVSGNGWLDSSWSTADRYLNPPSSKYIPPKYIPPNRRQGQPRAAKHSDRQNAGK